MLREIWKPLLFRPDNPQIDEVFQTTQRILEWWQKEFFYFFIACTIVGNNRNIMFSPCSPIFSPNGEIYVLFFSFLVKVAHWFAGFLWHLLWDLFFFLQSSPSLLHASHLLRDHTFHPILFSSSASLLFSVFAFLQPQNSKHLPVYSHLLQSEDHH